MPIYHTKLSGLTNEHIRKLSSSPPSVQNPEQEQSISQSLSYMDHQAEEMKSRHIGSGFSSYSDFHQPHLHPFEPSSSEIYTLAGGLGFQPKTLLPETPSFWQDSGRSLSLSLSSDDPSTIGLQTLDLRQTLDQQSDFRDGFGGKSGFHQQNHVSVQEQGHQFETLRSSKYLAPVQEILNELCCLGNTQKQKQDNNNSSFNMAGFSMQQQPLFAVDLMELHKRKKTLVVMLDELEKGHKHYVDKMEALVNSFEAAAGEGAARPYTLMASKAMSRHFRALRDMIISEMKAMMGGAGEMDSVEGSSGGSKGETPRLRALDQALRRHKALQEMSTMENRPWRPQRGLPEGSASVLRAWLFEHFLHPYPSDVDKHILARQTGLSRSQVSNWFINARVRLWKPMVEEMYLEEIKEGQLHSDMVAGGGGRTSSTTQILNLDHEALLLEDKNPNLDQRWSSSMDDAVDFPSYDDSRHSGFDLGYGRGGVSLTLGLQQDGPASIRAVRAPSSSVLYIRDEMVENQAVVEYSPFEGDDDQIQGHQNLLGADQLLHDFA